MNSFFQYMLVAFFTIYMVRALPMTLIRREIKSRFIRSFLYYVPFVTLAVMTFPSILHATGSSISAWCGFIIGLILAFVDGNLFRVAIASCLMVYVVEVFIL